MGPPKFIFNKILGDVNAAVVGATASMVNGQQISDVLVVCLKSSL